MEAGPLFASMFASLIGFALFKYGKKASRPPQLIVGLLLMVGPYFITSVLWIGVCSVALLAAMWGALKVGL